jgi:hypothetical protein
MSAGDLWVFTVYEAELNRVGKEQHAMRSLNYQTADWNWVEISGSVPDWCSFPTCR